MKGQRIEGYVILNHLGGLWTPNVFGRAQAADNHIATMQMHNPSWDLSKHTVVPATAVVYPKSRPAPPKED